MVLVSPQASKPGIDGIDPWRKRLLVRIGSPPRRGRANQELCEILSDLLSVKVRVIKGETSRTKSVLVPLEMEETIRLLEGIL